MKYHSVIFSAYGLSTRTYLRWESYAKLQMRYAAELPVWSTRLDIVVSADLLIFFYNQPTCELVKFSPTYRWSSSHKTTHHVQHMTNWTTLEGNARIWLVRKTTHLDNVNHFSPAPFFLNRYTTLCQVNTSMMLTNIPRMYHLHTYPHFSA